MLFSEQIRASKCLSEEQGTDDFKTEICIIGRVYDVEWSDVQKVYHRYSKEKDADNRGWDGIGSSTPRLDCKLGTALLFTSAAETCLYLSMLPV